MKSRLVFKDGEWRDSPVNMEGLARLRARIFELEQALSRSDVEKIRLRAEMESCYRDRDAARRQTQLLLNERGTLRTRALQIWVRVGKWLGIPQDST